jgi:hypothetical protein
METQIEYGEEVQVLRFANWERTAVLMVNLWVLFETGWDFEEHCLRDRGIERFLIFGICRTCGI